MLYIRNYLAKSPIENAGLGLYTSQLIKSGDLIWKMDEGLDIELMDLPTDEVKRDFVLKYGYIPLEGVKRWIICIDNAKYINHSETPNTFDTYHMTTALYDIPAHTELTSDYRDFAVNPFEGWDI